MFRSAIRAFPLALFVLAFFTTALVKAEKPAAARQPDKTPRVDRYGDPLPDEALARFGTVRFRSGVGLTFAVLSPDGRTVAINGGQQSVRLVDTKTGLTVRELAIPGARRVAFSRDGSLLAESVANGIWLYNAVSGAMVKSLETEERDTPGNPLFSADGQVIARAAWNHATGGEVRAWAVATGKLLAKCKLNGTRNVGAALAPDGERMISWGIQYDEASPTDWQKLADPSKSRDTVQLWNLRTGKEIRRLQIKGLGGVGGAAFSPDARTISVAGQGGVTALLNAADGTEIRRVGTPSKLPSSISIGATAERVVVRFSPDGKRLVVGHDGVQIWETDTGKRLSARDVPLGEVTSLAFVENQVLACGITGHAVCICDAATGKVRGAEDLPADRIASIALTWDVRRILTTDFTGRYSLWEFPSGRSLRTELLLGRRASAVWGYARDTPFTDVGSVLSPNGKYAVVADAASGERELRDPQAARKIAALPGMSFPGSLRAAFSRDGKLVAVAGTEVDTSLGAFIGQLIGGRGAGDASEVVNLRDSPTGKLVRRFRAQQSVRAVALSPDGRLVAVAELTSGIAPSPNGETVHTWEASTGKEVASFVTAPSARAFESGEPLVFSPDSSMLAVGDDPNLLCLHDASTGKRIRILTGHNEYLRASHIAFSPDGRLLAVAWGGEIGYGLGVEEGAQNIELWELCSASIRKRFTGHTGAVTALAFSDDGRLLASGSADTTTLVWDVSGRTLHPLSKVRVTAPEAEASWRQLASTNASEGYQAILRLTSSPDEALALFRKMLKPVPPAPDRKALQTLMHQFDSQRFTERQTAARKLKDAGKAALPFLKAALTGGASTDLHQRAEQLIDEINSLTLPGSGDIQWVRALEVLENINTPPAREVLKTLAQGRPDAGLTREAKAALTRLSAAR